MHCTRLDLRYIEDSSGRSYLVSASVPTHVVQFYPACLSGRSCLDETYIASVPTHVVQFYSACLSGRSYLVKILHQFQHTF